MAHEESKSEKNSVGTHGKTVTGGAQILHPILPDDGDDSQLDADFNINLRIFSEKYKSWAKEEKMYHLGEAFRRVIGETGARDLKYPMQYPATKAQVAAEYNKKVLNQHNRITENDAVLDEFWITDSFQGKKAIIRICKRQDEYYMFTPMGIKIDNPKRPGFKKQIIVAPDDKRHPYHKYWAKFKEDHPDKFKFSNDKKAMREYHNIYYDHNDDYNDFIDIPGLHQQKQGHLALSHHQSKVEYVPVRYLNGDYVSNEWLAVFLPVLFICICLFGIICMILMGFGGLFCYKEVKKSGGRDGDNVFNEPLKRNRGKRNSRLGDYDDNEVC